MGHQNVGVRKPDGDDTDTDDDNINSNNNNANSNSNNASDVASRAQKVLGLNFREWQQGLASGVRKLEEQDHPAAALIDSFCGPYLDRNDVRSNSRDENGNG